MEKDKQELKPKKYCYYPVGSLHPQGWAKKQLHIQASGLSGNLDLFWDDIKNSKWIGGNCEGWERVPYWLDGFIPLAYLLNDDSLKARAQRYIDAIISRQEQDGWICPCSENERNTYDMWALFLILKTLVVYHDATGDPRIEKVIYKALKNLDMHIDNHLLFDWAQMRWFECFISIYWLYERCPEKWLLTLCLKLKAQGFDYQGFYKDWPYKKPDQQHRWSQMSHVVNQAMMLKAYGLVARLDGKTEKYNKVSKDIISMLDKYHGQANGMFSGDECLSGKSPIQGTELCAVVEFMYSMEQLTVLTGDLYWADRLERTAFNALPATFSPDMWSHQYVQQVNQVQCSKLTDPPFHDNNGEAHLFGLEPNYGCCTANLSQGWPKFLQSVFMKRDSEIAIVQYLPIELEDNIGDASIHIGIETEYPFREDVHIKVHTDKSVSFKLRLRIPKWSTNTLVTVNDSVMDQLAISGEFFDIEKVWDKYNVIHIHFSMATTIEKRPHTMGVVVRGPLLYSVKIDEKWVQIPSDDFQHAYPHCDYEIYPQSEWNYCIADDMIMNIRENEISTVPFSNDNAPVELGVNCRNIKWGIWNGCAVAQPESRQPCGETRVVPFIPYGCTNLRMTELPVLE